jgi:hypothetical protein
LWWHFVHKPSYWYLGRIRRWERLVHTFLTYSKSCDYSCGPIPWSFSGKKQVSPNRPKGILSCRAWKVVFVVKKSAITTVPLGRYRSHSFSWKSWKFLKNQKNLQNLWSWVFSYYMVKNEFKIYILVLHELADSPICFFLFCICMEKMFFGAHWWSLTEMIMLTSTPYELR